MPPDGEAWSFDRKTTDLLVKSRTLTREKGQTFLGYDIFLWGDDTVFGEIKDSKLPPGLGITKLYDFPLGIAAKMRRWQALGADGFFDQWGTQAEYVPCNAVALRELVFHPENAEPAKLDAWAQSLAARRFGPAAAPQVLAAWKEIEVAQQIQSDHTYYWHHLRPAWSGPVLRSPLTVEALQDRHVGRRRAAQSTRPARVLPLSRRHRPRQSPRAGVAGGRRALRQSPRPSPSRVTIGAGQRPFRR